MDPDDWSSWNVDQAARDSLVDPLQKPDDKTGDSKPSAVYDTNTIAGDDYNLQFEDGFDSYEESESQTDEDGDDSQSENFGIPTSIDTTPYRFMNGNDGMATCERCGAVGIKHAFYSKSKRFCSLACSRAAQDGDCVETSVIHYPKKPPIAAKKQKSGKLRLRRRTKSSSNRQGVAKSFDWGPYVAGANAEGAPVSCFKHVPMADSWENISIGMKVETRNHDCDLSLHVYWIATVMKIAGYKALMRYEGFGSDSVKDFWISICCKDIHPVGWCATSSKPLVPPKTIQHKYVDWKDYLVKRLTGSRTLPSNFYSKVQESMTNHKLRPSMHVEVVNRMCVSSMRVATVEEIIGGRLRLHYDDAKEELDEFWCHMNSALLHPVGWAQQVGHKLNASQEYRDQCLGKITMQKYSSSDATPDMFPKVRQLPEGYRFQVDQKLEAIDPLNLSAICVATVMKVLKNNYLMIGMDGSIAQNGTDWFCYHATSPCIFPVGFCEVNGLTLTPPRGSVLPFKWFDYLKQTRCTAAPVKLFDKEIPKHGFKAGMKVEAVDLMEPRLICVGTVARVVGRLLRVHFDGWESEYDQWVDCESPDIYPVGWCDIMDYQIEGPRIKEVQASHHHHHHTKKRKGKTQIYKGPRKKRKPKTPLSPPHTIKSMSSQFDLMHHRLLNTRPEESGERPVEVPVASEPASVSEITPSQTEVKTEQLVSHVVKSEVAPVSSYILSANQNTQSQSPNRTPANPKPVLSTAIKPAVTVAASIRASHIPPPNVTVTSNSVPVATKSALLERITTKSLTNQTLLAGHLTTNLPLKLNSGMVVTTTGQPVSQAARQHGQPETQTLYLTQRQQTLSPQEWSMMDVCHFLKYNDCSAYVEIFHRNNIDGRTFVSLTKEQIVSLTGMKVGSSLKIFELIQVLKSKMASQQKYQVQKMTT